MKTVNNRGPQPKPYRNRVRRMIGNGLSSTEIVRIVGCTFAYITNQKKAMGLDISRKNRKGLLIPRVRQLIDAGLSYKDISEILGISRTRVHQLKNPQDHAARMALNAAIEKGQVIRPEMCSKCGRLCVPHGHHEDYTKPLEVVWLCRPCHRDADEDRRYRIRHGLNVN